MSGGTDPRPLPDAEPATEDALARLRELCLDLPEVTERLSHGAPTWFVRGKKAFVIWSTGHHGAGPGIWCAAPEGAQQAYLANQPGRYFRPPYVGHRGWLGVHLDVPDLDWSLLEEHVVDAYLVVAPRRLVQQLRDERGLAPG